MDENRNLTAPADIKILIAEDEDSNYRYIEKLLSKIGYRLLRARNGYEAVEFARIYNDIDLILMDIKMPVKNGVEATREIRLFKPNLPIIATTAFAIPGDRDVFLKAGCDEYIPKPIKSEVLIEMVNRFVS
ncbi:MAG: response regulator [Lentimicrobium sp.]|jgi:CheY-like chemotaxis protein|nr:response regulator [Lentimicrobium sp.]